MLCQHGVIFPRQRIDRRDVQRAVWQRLSQAGERPGADIQNFQRAAGFGVEKPRLLGIQRKLAIQPLLQLLPPLGAAAGEERFPELDFVA